MLLSPVMHTDCTNARENGKSCQVYVCATPDGKALYFAREKKGHEGVKGTVAEDYQGILVHDHDITFYNYGADHQECLAHVLRYLKASIENEPDRTWNKKMHALVQEMVHFRNGCRQPHGPDPSCPIIAPAIFIPATMLTISEATPPPAEPPLEPIFPMPSA